MRHAAGHLRLSGRYHMQTPTCVVCPGMSAHVMPLGQLPSDSLSYEHSSTQFVGSAAPSSERMHDGTAVPPGGQSSSVVHCGEQNGA